MFAKEGNVHIQFFEITLEEAIGQDHFFAQGQVGDSLYIGFRNFCITASNNQGRFCCFYTEVA